jgi:hypothetical protein
VTEALVTVHMHGRGLLQIIIFDHIAAPVPEIMDEFEPIYYKSYLNEVSVVSFIPVFETLRKLDESELKGIHHLLICALSALINWESPHLLRSKCDKEVQLFILFSLPPFLHSSLLLCLLNHPLFMFCLSSHQSYT